MVLRGRPRGRAGHRRNTLSEEARPLRVEPLSVYIALLGAGVGCAGRMDTPPRARCSKGEHRSAVARPTAAPHPRAPQGPGADDDPVIGGLAAVIVETFRRAEIKHAVRRKSFRAMQNFHAPQDFHVNVRSAARRAARTGAPAGEAGHVRRPPGVTDGAKSPAYTATSSE